MLFAYPNHCFRVDGVILGQKGLASGKIKARRFFPALISFFPNALGKTEIREDLNRGLLISRLTHVNVVLCSKEAQ